MRLALVMVALLLVLTAVAVPLFSRQARSSMAGFIERLSAGKEPMILLETPIIMSSTSDDDSVTLEWTIREDIEYCVELKEDGGNYVAATQFEAGMASCTIPDLDTNTPYSFRVRGRKIENETTAYSQYSEPLIARTGPKVTIYLTFDDGPSSESTLMILDVLAENDIKATFFMQGRRAENNKDVVRKVSHQGHVVANHGYSHDYEAIYTSTEAFMSDMRKSEEAIEAALGEKPAKVLRFPGGSVMGALQRNPDTWTGIKTALENRGYRYYDWDVSLGDSRKTAPEEGLLAGRVIEQIRQKVRAGDYNIVMLAHDNNSHPWTPLAIPAVIEYCKLQGFHFGTLTTKSPPCSFK